LHTKREVIETIPEWLSKIGCTSIMELTDLDDDDNVIDKREMYQINGVWKRMTSNGTFIPFDGQ